MSKFIKLAMAAVVMLVTAPSFAAAYAASDDAVITVVWTSDTSVAVASTKEISNVVLEDCSGVHYKYDDLDGLVGTFEHPSGEAITTVWVKSGSNNSGDGPGYGEKFTNPDVVCDEETTTTTIPDVTPTTLPDVTPTTLLEETTTTTMAPTPAPVPEAPLAAPRQLPRTGVNASLATTGALVGLAGLTLMLTSALYRRRNTT